MNRTDKRCNWVDSDLTKARRNMLAKIGARGVIRNKRPRVVYFPKIFTNSYRTVETEGSYRIMKAVKSASLKDLGLVIKY